ncbi:MAG: hypothetical protein IKR25_00165 [Muribaculaceae bacterium]|nr:hypothetical protein [Muribaculaceae bacterium]
MNTSRFLNIQIWLIIFSLLSITTTSCRDDSDEFLSYSLSDEDNDDNFSEAKASLAGQFKAIWKAMNNNYPLWDYEEAHGVDWDKTYRDFLPKFEELDRMYNFTNPVPDEIICELYNQIFAQLHDGHSYLQLKNIHTNQNIKKQFSPSYQAIQERFDKEVTWLSMLKRRGILAYYNNQYNYCGDAGGYTFVRFNDEIMYFGLLKCQLAAAFEQRSTDSDKDKICQVWQAWFDAIQQAHNERSLKGVILDLRFNTGGTANDFQYLIGALINGPEQLLGYTRMKTGVGRLDYSCLFPFTCKNYSEPHVNVDVPIVVLCNVETASMAELLCLAAKQLPNGHVIGTQTYGAFSPIVEPYRVTYAGTVGDPELTRAPFYIYMPSAAFFSKDKKVIEGQGVIPDEVVELDISVSSDSQLDRALEYIRKTSHAQ